ncbi:MAG: patatin-like phospholipase family protein, partial [Pontiella sp.]|nr:patatin-like phospholipase family protein [Pontiella sp.]
AMGFAHIPILEVFDELGIKPCCITGTSVGAIMGALYASGHSAKDIADMLGHLLTKSENSSLKDFFRNKEMFKFLQLIDPQFSLKPKGLIKGDKLLGFLTEQLQVSTFKELKIPLKVVATDFWNKQQVVFESGELLPAVRASMALPYIFTPVILDGQVLVDGGLVNNVPHDLLSPKCDIRIAVDITGNHTEPKDRVPTPMDAVFHTYSVMRDAMSQEKRSNHPVDIYLEPPLVDIDMFDFHKADTIYRQGLGAKDDFKRKLDRLISNKRPLSGWLRKT